MLYLGIDQHARQITISLRDENGDVVMARQVSTRPEKIQEFFQRLTVELVAAQPDDQARQHQDQQRLCAQPGGQVVEREEIVEGQPLRLRLQRPPRAHPAVEPGREQDEKAEPEGEPHRAAE